MIGALHGVIFASYADFLAARFGSHVARAVSKDEPIYLMSETYEDERLVRLLERTATATDVPVPTLLRSFGVFTAQTTFARLYPAFFTIAKGTRPFLLTVETRIHELVRATIPNSEPPQLHVAPLGTEGVTIAYTSSRRLCVLLEGLVEGTASHYGETATMVQSECMLRGDPACLFEVELSRPAHAA